MLKSIDVLIGLTVILLALSMTVTVITQSITSVINSRGRHLRRGLTDLLQQLDPALTAALSAEVATRLLTHPLVSGSNTPMSSDGRAGTRWWSKAVAFVRRLAGGPRLGTVVHREEFSKLLMVLGADDRGHGLTPVASNALKVALANNGITNPDATLRRIRTLALQLERSRPDSSNMVRQNAAIIQAAESDLVAKINSWFDQTMDRTSQRFTASTRAITFAAGFVVAFGLQVDTAELVNRLAANDQLRDAFVREAGTLYAEQAGAPAPLSAQNAAAAAVERQPDPLSQEEIDRKYRSFLATNGVITLPGPGRWWGAWDTVNPFGLLVTALLLSLGAPFWYSALGQLLRLRSVIAVKDDAQRMVRQSTETLPVSAGGQPRPPVSPAGERGDLAGAG